MNNITLSDLFLILFVWIDDWYQQTISSKGLKNVGKKAEFSDSEMLTLLIAMDFIEFASERHYVEFIRANYVDLFPALLDHSQYNRRGRALANKLEQLRLALVTELGAPLSQYRLIDTTPVIAVGYTRSKRHSDFLGSADYGYCAARKMHYFGYKLVLVTDLEGVPCQLELVPANTDERAAADEVLDQLPAFTWVLGDKGFLGQDWQAQWQRQAIYLITPARKNQVEPRDSFLSGLGKRYRKRIEGAYKVLKDYGRSIERTLAHTVEGLCARIIAKVTSITMRLFLKRRFSINILTFCQS